MLVLSRVKFHYIPQQSVATKFCSVVLVTLVAALLRLHSLHVVKYESIAFSQGFEVSCFMGFFSYYCHFESFQKMLLPVNMSNYYSGKRLFEMAGRWSRQYAVKGSGPIPERRSCFRRWTRPDSNPVLLTCWRNSKRLLMTL